MNSIEKQMVTVLNELAEKYGVFEVKAEFEAEGSRMEEMMRLKDVTAQAGLPIILKIGGVEAVTDVYQGLSLGVKGIIAPMAETPYALSKFTDLIDNYVSQDDKDDIDFAVNIETAIACENFPSMLTLPNIGNLSGVTVGRVDLVGSMGLGRSDINTSALVESTCRQVFSLAKEKSLKTAMGGGISTDAFPVISRMAEEGLIDKYETRKIVFPIDAVKYGEQAILKSIEFELLWLKNKCSYYSRVGCEDNKRIEMLEARLNV